MVEAPPVGPPVQRARRALLAVRGQMPLAERRGAVPVALQHLRERRAVLGDERRVPGKPLDSSPIDPKPTAWWLRPVSSAARVGEHSAVTWNRL